MKLLGLERQGILVDCVQDDMARIEEAEETEMSE